VDLKKLTASELSRGQAIVHTWLQRRQTESDSFMIGRQFAEVFKTQLPLKMKIPLWGIKGAQIKHAGFVHSSSRRAAALLNDKLVTGRGTRGEDSADHRQSSMKRRPGMVVL